MCCCFSRSVDALEAPPTDLQLWIVPGSNATTAGVPGVGQESGTKQGAGETHLGAGVERLGNALRVKMVQVMNKLCSHFLAGAV